MAVKFELTGVNEVIKGLHAVTDHVFHEKILQGAMKSALQPILKQARFDAPEGPTGNLRNSIGVRSAKVRKPATTAAAVQFGVFSPHAYIVQEGTGPRFKKSDGQYVGIMPPNLFFAIAVEQHAPAYQASLGSHIIKETDKAAKKFLG